MVDVTSAAAVPDWTEASALPLLAKSTEVVDTWLRVLVAVPAVAVAAMLLEVKESAESLVAPVIANFSVVGVPAPSSFTVDETEFDCA
jgi:hypothetical protein